MRTVLPALFVLLVGCDRLDGEGEFVGVPCAEQGVLASGPPDATVEGYLLTPVWVDLACPEASFGLSATRSDGLRVPGTVTSHHGGRQARWVPDERLTPRTQYTARFESPAGALAWTFTTNAIGEAGADDLAGRGYALYLAEGSLLGPPGLRSTLQGVLDELHLVVEFVENPEGPEDMLPIRLGARTDAAADAPADDSVTPRTLSARWDAPLFEAGPFPFSQGTSGGTFALENARLGGGLGPDLAWGGGIAFSGWLDLRALGDDDALCAETEAAGGECTECADGARACVRFESVLSRATSWSGTLP